MLAKDTNYVYGKSQLGYTFHNLTFSKPERLRS